MSTSAPILVTGVAGFIGFHVAQRLLARAERVIGADCLTPYYDVGLKEARLRELSGAADFTFVHVNLADAEATSRLFAEHRPTRVVHLAAQPGVRRALIEPRPYVDSNVVAFLNMLEGCRHGGAEHLVYASSSSVYGANRKLPFSEHDGVDHPVSLYAATKKANELMAHSYAHLFGLPATGLRFFTVYGPWGRPDMAVYAFTDAIAKGRPIEVANAGAVWRDFTYIDDIAEGVVRVLDRVPQPDPAWDAVQADPATSAAPHRVYNIGNNRPEKLDRLVSLIERALNRRAQRIDVALPPGDVLETRADITDLQRDVGFAPSTSLEEGVGRFVAWYRTYHGL
ncbi:NAD-dependent epimerase [Chelatococcus sp. SYSU_G07232]|uniref:NAD-dependent epimerase n=1 Tax=Chelatococcus albus TaxID=3047466 RepID=A0ABT7AHF6_9HYPH|nr:NAD-dependent epimerase [Chelatococcus sp. SYSU_G07232]MDJ1158807.1 NAD-dependent epimerase [Chelatococcus sp. SYSU_G07232]